MTIRFVMSGLAAIAVLASTLSPASAAGGNTPPMGWNSWDSFGTTISEQQFKDVVDVEAKVMKPVGYEYAVVDMEWFVHDPIGKGNVKDSVKSMDANGRYIPVPARFPSSANGKGFKAIADYVHSKGLKFGIHILRGIPKEAVDQNLPIAGSKFRAADAASKDDTCFWNPDNYGVDVSKQAGKDYYKSLVALYASWGVDFIKADCMASQNYRSAEIGVLSDAMKASGRQMLLSLSPGGAPQTAIADLRKQAVMWRISGDVWDYWSKANGRGGLSGLVTQFDRAASWASLTQKGAYPDADMLVLGHLGPAPGSGDTRETLMTPDEQKTFVTLWSIFRSPLMMGGNLTKLDDATRALITNPEVIAVDQHSHDAKQVVKTEKMAAWTSLSDDGKATHVALFNLEDAPAAIKVSYADLGLKAASYRLRDLWNRKDLGAASDLSMTVPAHGSVLLKLTR